MLLYHVLLWFPVLLVYITSSVLHISLVQLIVGVRKRISQYNSLFYRLFVIQSILENALIFFYITGWILIRERMAGNEFIMSTNSWIFGSFPEIYYFGTVHFFFNVQVWGLLMQSFASFVAICAPDSRVKRILDSIPNWAWWLVKIIIPMLSLINYVIREPVHFELDKDGNTLLYVPLVVIEVLATQGTAFTIIGIVFSAVCYLIVLMKLRRFKRSSGYSNIAKYRKMRNIAFVGCMLLLALCTMAAYNIIVALTAVKYGRPAHLVRHLFIIPVLLMTFVNPRMLLLTDTNLRKG